MTPFQTPPLQGTGTQESGEGHPCSSRVHSPEGETGHCRWAVTELHDVQGDRQVPEAVEIPRGCVYWAGVSGKASGRRRQWNWVLSGEEDFERQRRRSRSLQEKAPVWDGHGEKVNVLGAKGTCGM